MEVLVSTVLLLLLATGGWRILALHHRAAAELVHRAERLEVARTVDWVLARELRRGGRVDRGVVAADSVSLRAFRGSGRVCGQADSLLAVVPRGSRAADPGKDSVLVLSAAARWTLHGLVRLEPHGACGEGSGSAEGWILDPAPAGRAVVVRYFERGSYHVSTGALRYRRGLSGRQPLTAQVLGRGSALEERGGAVRTVLEWAGAPEAVRWSVHTFPPRERAGEPDPSAEPDPFTDSEAS